ncbi:MAG TPA: o-succinylbenzoate--CoA ligase, partial [candidate division Zixibacteria bacterium]|nr:o-succinylbenzoate--CoA ligase [candidate division Zixibacteria bacterium]
LFQGYLKGDSAFLPLDADGWFHTGDMGELNQKGLLTVLGRKDHMFISGGENIHPEEIESHLAKLDGIEQVLVVGIADEEFGARPAAFIKYSNGEVLSQKKITALLEKELPRYKIPKRYFDWPENLDNGALKLPRTEFLKLAESLTPKRRRQTQEVSS